jgi:hypothetical protein
MTPDELIAAAIDSFLESTPKELSWLVPSVRSHRYLPLYVGWLAVVGIRVDGSFVRLHADGRMPESPALETNPFWTRMALFTASRTRPELRALLPSRPPSALDCLDCGATGVLGDGRIVCACGGSGWLVPGEGREDTPG